MAGITVSGITSGLDVNNIIDSLVAAESDPATARLDFRELETDAELSGVATLKSALSAFRDAASPLAFASTFQSLSGSSSDAEVVDATASSIANAGTHLVEVSQLARSHSLASKAFESTTDALGEGTLSIRFGTYDGGGNTFTPNTDKTTQNLTIDASNNSLQGIRETINNADFGVQASLVNDGSGFRLVLRSNDTGAANSLEITVSGDTDGQNTDDAGLSQLAFDPTAAGVGTGKNLSETASALDANFTVDGLAITKSSNVSTDVIEGVTVTLNAETSGTPITLTIQRDTGELRDGVDSFIAAYNDLAGIMSQLGGYDAEQGVGGILVGDSMLRNLQSQLRSTIGSVGAGLTGSVRSLADVGITTASDGSLALSNESALIAALNSAPNDVAGLFSAVGRNDDPLINFLSSTDSSQAGTHGVNITQLATKGEYQGVNTASFVVDADNDELTLRVNGAQSATITLAQQTYASGDDLAAALEAQINSDGVITAAGARVDVAYNSGRLEITSQLYGAASKVEITSVDTTTAATLGLGVGIGTSVDGLDVAGTIGGVAATGVGQILTGAGKASGLTVEVLGGAVGSRSSINFARGFADELLNVLDSYLDDGGVLSDRTSSLDARTEGITEDRESLQVRLDALEERLRIEFTSLELVLAQLQSTSDFLTQQLSALSPSRNS